MNIGSKKARKNNITIEDIDFEERCCCSFTVLFIEMLHISWRNDDDDAVFLQNIREVGEGWATQVDYEADTLTVEEAKELLALLRR